MRTIVVLALAGLCAACAGTARVYPMDDASLAAGTPKFDFVMYGTGHGPVTVTMPDGEVLHGEYQVTENAAIGVAMAGTHVATGIAAGGGRPVAVNAVGPHGTILTCDGVLDINGHGSLICQTNHSTKYRLMV